ncbi:hypothetical protein [Pediococcus claussenii]|uniref:hypothetical protein n=1 Tax=Pediococcus claussenii TaxID=187452 RepID=UPI00081A55E8|nr:hypothetical protein [Pediococcus claussenii]ANZ70354.1 hypothetical protein AYR57_08515 [Pediococcus claussenii]ANZ72170.1 hypothetical protein AYR58_08515 [Pediococcus claussenii]
MSYMNYSQYQKIMKENNLEPSMAVNLFLNRAKHFQQIIRNIEDKLADDPGNEILLSHINKLNIERWKSVWFAIDCARFEKIQGFKFFEAGGGDKYVNSLMIIHEGNAAEFTEIEKGTVAYFEMLDKMRKRQEAGHFD